MGLSPPESVSTISSAMNMPFPDYLWRLRRTVPCSPSTLSARAQYRIRLVGSSIAYAARSRNELSQVTRLQNGPVVRCFLQKESCSSRKVWGHGGVVHAGEELQTTSPTPQAQPATKQQLRRPIDYTQSEELGLHDIREYGPSNESCQQLSFASEYTYICINI